MQSSAYVDRLAEQEGLTGSFVHKQALKLFSHLLKCDSDLNTEYISKLCYWMATCLDPDYGGECIYDLLPPWNGGTEYKQYKRLEDEAVEKIIKTTFKIVSLCSGNLLNPHSGPVQEKQGLECTEATILGKGAYGTVYLIDGYAVKMVPYKTLDLPFAAILRETTVLAMLNRLQFIGLNATHYYVGMDYYPQTISFKEPAKTMYQLSMELFNLHSLGIIHCDIKLQNVMTDPQGHARLIDFGSCRFIPAGSASTYIGSDAYRDYLLLKQDVADYSYEIDIWALGVVFYMLELNRAPWDLPETVKDYAQAIETQWQSVMVSASSLIRGMLTLDKEERWTINQVISYF